jgi:hypothetical protein
MRRWSRPSQVGDVASPRRRRRAVGACLSSRQMSGVPQGKMTRKRDASRSMSRGRKVGGRRKKLERKTPKPKAETRRMRAATSAAGQLEAEGGHRPRNDGSDRRGNGGRAVGGWRMRQPTFWQRRRCRTVGTIRRVRSWTVRTAVGCPLREREHRQCGRPSERRPTSCGTRVARRDPLVQCVVRLALEGSVVGSRRNADEAESSSGGTDGRDVGADRKGTVEGRKGAAGGDWARDRATEEHGSNQPGEIHYGWMADARA